MTENTHELVGSITASPHNVEGSVDFKEITCQGKYLFVQYGANYCPKCGGEL